jgi:hypothetical protein
MKTIDLPEELSFKEALTAMMDGKCLGIRPGANTGYLELYDPMFIRPTTIQNYWLRWHGSEDRLGIQATQFLEDNWHLVIMDHREINAQEGAGK